MTDERASVQGSEDRNAQGGLPEAESRSVQDEIVGFGEGNVVVSASAGCGKTTAMIRRIVNLILERRCGVDEILVVTFTNAAASEMREKLARALKEKNDGGYVLDQLFKLESADICTIDSFCNRILKRYFFEAEIDPDFEIADAGEAAMLKARAAEAVIAEHYESGDEIFLRLTDVFSGDRTDRDLTKMLMRLVDLSANFPDRDSFLREILPGGCDPDGPAGRFLLEDIESTFALFRERFRALEGDCCQSAGDAAGCAELLELLGTLRAEGIDGWREALGSLTLPRTKPLKKEEKGDPAFEGAHAAFMGEKKCLTDAIKRFREKYLTMSEAELREKAADVRPLLEKLAELAGETVAGFDALKSRSAMLDFNDVERFAFRILQNDEIRGELRKKYRYVFLDEAQDINLFQEELLALIVRPASEELERVVDGVENSEESGNAVNGAESFEDSAKPASFGNEFLVGDVKQCIYRFRGARPEIFANRCRAGESKPGFFRLSENFRTNADLLRFVNTVFSGCMRGGFCSVDYGATERLEGKKQGKIDDGRPAVICNLVPERKLEKRIAEGVYQIEPDPENAGTAEGLRIAGEITELISGCRIVGDGEPRAVRYSDVAVLVRGKKVFSDAVRSTLRTSGIPLSCDFEYPLFHFPEVTTLVSYLKLIDNFRQDVPLAACLGSSFGGFTSAELAEIRVRAPGERYFCDAFLAAAGRVSFRNRNAAGDSAHADNVSAASHSTFEWNADSASADSCPTFEPHAADEAAAALEDSLRAKCNGFLNRLDGFRRRAKYENCFDLISAVVRETNYDVFLEREGEGRASRLRSFLDSVRGKTFCESLSKFLRFTETFSDSFLLAERTSAADSVLVTTIHKSKGLEYPIVFLAGLGGSFNRADQRNLVNFDSELGGGMDWFDPGTRTRVEFPLANAVKRSIRYNTVRDELNLLYVAMTRAKYRMYLSGVVKDGEVRSRDVRDADSFLDFLLPVLAEGGAEICSAEEFECDRKRGPVPVYRTDLSEYLPSFGWKYPGELGVPVKHTVTELNSIYEESARPAERNLFSETTGDPRKIGNAYHKFLQFGNTHISDLAAVEEEFDRLSGILSPAERAMLDSKKLLSFFETVHRPRNPVKILREQPFMLSVPLKELIPGASGERVLVQGKIDLLFVYEDGVEVVDYKFSGLAEAALVERYGNQVRIYCAAAEKCTGLPVKGAWLYSFGRNRLVSVKY